VELAGDRGGVVAPLTLGGRYQLGEELGRGGMGVVRAGVDLRLQRDVAVKLLHSEMAAQPGIRDRFEVEARAAASLVHPHVVAVFDSGEEAGIPFLVMERLAGRTLADAIDAGPMDPDAVRELGLQVLDALAAAHASGLIHRDIKPANVLAAGPGNWKVGDFGIAKSVELTDPGLTSTGLVVGTPAYLAPERLAGAAATPGSDLYAVGVVLYEALVGHRSRVQSSPASLYWQPRPALDQVRPGLPADLVAAVARATMPDPAARFRSAPEMAAWLRLRANGQGVPAAAAPTQAFASPLAATEVFRGGRHGPLAQGFSRSPRHHRNGPREPLAEGFSPSPRHPRNGPRQPLARWVSHARQHPRAVLAALAAAVVLALLIVILAISGGGPQGAPSVTPTTSVTAPAPAGGQPPTSLPAPLADALQRLQRAVQP
jgi:serine/threonine protein kinase